MHKNHKNRADAACKHTMNIKRETRKKNISRKHHDKKTAKLFWFLWEYECVCAPLSPSRERRAGGSRRSIFTSVSLPRSFSVGEGFGDVWAHCSVSVLLEGTPCSYALITQILHVISRRERGRGVYRAKAWVTAVKEMHSPLMPTPFCNGKKIKWIHREKKII